MDKVPNYTIMACSVDFDLTSTSASCDKLSDIIELISIVSFNMHGFNQGSHVIKEMVVKLCPDIFLLQEHWLTPANLYKFSNDFPDYVSFGKSAMESAVEAGPITGRPYGGVVTLVKRSLCPTTKIINATDRYVLIQIDSCVILNMYLPCVGTADRSLIISNILCEVESYLDSLSGVSIIVGGDLNVDLCSVQKPVQSIADSLVRFFSRYNLARCDQLSNKVNKFTYCNESLNHYSCLDYILVSDIRMLHDFNIIDPDINLSDHPPVYAVFKLNKTLANKGRTGKCTSSSSPGTPQHRWDKANLALYYLSPYRTVHTGSFM